MNVVTPRMPVPGPKPDALLSSSGGGKLRGRSRRSRAPAAFPPGGPCSQVALGWHRRPPLAKELSPEQGRLPGGPVP